MIKDFKYIISPIIIDDLSSKYIKTWPIIYGYLMQHEFCELIKFTTSDIIDTLGEFIENDEKITYDEKNECFTIYSTNNGCVYIIKKILKLMCFNIEEMQIQKPIIKFKIKSMFSNEEISYNRKRFEINY